MAKRVAIVDTNLCRPKDCGGQPCRKICPVSRQGKECITIGKVAIINESVCLGEKCGLCQSKCVFNAITIVNLPSELPDLIVNRYGTNGFKLFKLPILKPNQVLSLLGRNGVGKTTVIKILGNKLKPNFENFKEEKSDADIVKMFRGTEVQKYLELLYKDKLKLAIKPQLIEFVVTTLKRSKLDPTVKEFLLEYQTRKFDDPHLQEVIKDMEIDVLLDYKVITLSGGELQRLSNTVCLLKEANVFIFDEPTNYLDVKQRLKVAKQIQKLRAHNRYVVVIDHDLSFLDFVSDYTCIMYGIPGAYGVVSIPYSTPEAINIYFDGYIPAENMRFRKDEYSLNSLSSINDDIKASKDFIDYKGSVIEYPKFRLVIEDSKINIASMNVVLSVNGAGKSTFLNYLMSNTATLKLAMSMKSQILSCDKFKDKDNTYPTVKDLFLTYIRGAYSSALFMSDVIHPMDISQIENRTINDLSGGELQKVMIIYCLGQEADVYLLDEPSACLDVEQRATTTKVLKRFIQHNRKTCFIVEHDISMAVSIAQEHNSQIIVFDPVENYPGEAKRTNKVSQPKTFKDGINTFLKSMDITFRTESQHNRPRINKYDSVKDREQKQKGQYYA